MTGALSMVEEALVSFSSSEISIRSGISAYSGSLSFDMIRLTVNVFGAICSDSCAINSGVNGIVPNEQR